MKKAYLPLLFTLSMALLWSCKTTKDTTMDVPGTVRKAFYKISPTMYTVSFVINTTEEDIEIDSIYFRGGRAKLEVVPSASGKAFKGIISRLGGDLIMDADSQREFKNKLDSEFEEELPIPITDNEGLVRYTKGEKVLYFKIKKFRKEALAVE